MTESRFVEVVAAATGALLAAGLALSAAAPLGAGDQALAVAIFSAIGLTLVCARRVPHGPVRGWRAFRHSLPFLIPMGGLTLWTLVQALNPTHAADPDNPWVVPRPLDPVAWLPGSFHAANTMTAAGLMACGLLLFLLVRTMGAAAGHAHRVAAVALVFGAAGISTLCIVQRLEHRPFPVFPVTGTFVNENQFAAAINLILPLSLWLASDFRRRARREGRVHHPGPLFWLSSGILATSVFLTSSRAGVAICSLILVIFLGREWLRNRPRGVMRARRPPGWVLAVMVLFCLVVAGWEFRRTNLGRQLGEIGKQLDFRARICLSTLDIFQDHPVKGVGVGTFSLVYPFYRDDSVKGRLRHTHCEPVQLLAEGGLPGAFLALMALLGGFVGGKGGEKGARLRFCARLGVLGLVLHSLIDFPFRDTSIFLTFLFMLALAGGAGDPERPDPGRDEEPEEA